MSWNLPSISTSLPAVLAGSLLAAPAQAQTFSWETTYPGPGAEGLVHDIASFDDGTGAATYVCGVLRFADDVPVDLVAKWDGTSWSAPFDPGATTAVDRLVVLDDGGGQALFAFSRMGGILRWDGQSLTTIAPPSTDLERFDDGLGSALYRSEGGALFRESGGAWIQQGPSLGGTIVDLFAFDDGSGPALYAAGDFVPNASADVAKVARWDGSAWSAVGTAIAGSAVVRRLNSFDDGTGKKLVAVGSVAAGLGSVARWDGQVWSPVGTLGPGTLDLRAFDVEVFDDGAGKALFVTVPAPNSLLIGSLLRLDASTGAWVSTLNSVTSGAFTQAGFQDHAALAVVPGANGRELALAGNFGALGDPRFGEVPVGAKGIATWDGSTFKALGDGPGLSGFVNDVLVVGSGAGRRVFAGGEFVAAGTAPARFVAELVGGAWQQVGAGLPEDVVSLAEFRGLVVASGGRFSLQPYVQAWDGSQWAALGTLLPGVRAFEEMLVWDDGSGPALYGAHSGGVDRWDGSQWFRIPGPAANGAYADLETWDDGSGEALYVLGRFHLGRWDGSTWTQDVPPWGPLQARVMEVLDEGSGPQLFIYNGGSFSGTIGRWDGATWTQLPSVGGISELFRHESPNGPVLLASGQLGGFGNFARWNGAGWVAVAQGVDRPIRAFATSVAERTLIVGGEFQRVGGAPSACVAELLDEAPVATSYCSGKLNSLGCVPFLAFDGAPTVQSGVPFDVRAEDVLPAEAGFLIYSSAKANLGFHGGTLCVKSPFRRALPVQAAASTGTPPCSGVLSQDFALRIQAGTDPALTAGRVVFAQYLQRDPADPAGFGDSLTDGVRFRILP